MRGEGLLENRIGESVSPYQSGLPDPLRVTGITDRVAALSSAPRSRRCAALTASPREAVPPLAATGRGAVPPSELLVVVRRATGPSELRHSSAGGCGGAPRAARPIARGLPSLGDAVRAAQRHQRARRTPQRAATGTGERLFGWLHSVAMPPSNAIVVSGAREHNLKDVSLTLPRDALVVITGLSGSGKSSLAFDTIYAEGQRRYVESLSAYARQFLGQMDKPDVDSIEGLSPAISIDQKTTSRNPRSTVGTVTEIYDYLRLLWARIGHPHCHICGKPIAGQSAEQIIDQVMELEEGTRFMVLAPLVRGRKGEYGKALEELRAEGFSRAKIDGELRMLEDEIVLDKKYKHDISIVVDRLVMRGDLRKRLADSIETAVALADGMIEIETVPKDGTRHRHAVLREVRLPRPRAGHPRARAADLLLQLAARRVPALHRPGLADGDRPRARRARSVAVDRRGRAGAVGGLDVAVLRADHPGHRREVRHRPRGAVGVARRGRARPLPQRHQRRPHRGLLSQPLRAQALVRDALRGHPAQPRAPLPRDRLRPRAREDRGVHVAAAVPGVQGRAAEARVAGGAGRRRRHPRADRAERQARAAVAGRRAALRDRAPHRAADRARDRRAPALPGQRRHRLPVDGPRGGDAVGRRGAAHPAGHADRLGARRRALRARRAVDRPAPARQLQAHRHARAPARAGQHGARRRARRADDARGRPPRRPRPGRRRARRADHRRGHRGAGREGQGVAHGPVPGRHAHHPGARRSGARRPATSRSAAPSSTTSSRSTSTSRWAC